MSSDFCLSPLFCLHNGVIVLQRKENLVTFGLLNVDDVALKARLMRAVTSYAFSDKNVKADFVPLAKDSFDRKIALLYDSKDERTTDSKGQDKTSIENDKTENEIASLLDSIISYALGENASDIHIDNSGVRIRVMGSLLQVTELSEKTKQALVQRIKLLADINIVESRRAQDGQFVFTKKNGKNVFVRVSLLPQVNENNVQETEALVLRLLDVEKLPLSFSALGFSDEQKIKLCKLCRLEAGLVLICGATGSGKSSTAAAMLVEVKNFYSQEKKIISLEDPPEYVIPGITQVKIQANCGMDFAEILRHALRHDPDVILIGEIRDKETALIALQASLTGHLVFATLHSGSIEQTPLRLEKLGVEKSALDCVLKACIFQRLQNGKLSAQIKIFGEQNE